ncbi:MAG: acyl carrier protein [Opitutales bacterium]|nr:acyl carrier protein [Opitutales bacterium]
MFDQRIEEQLRRCPPGTREALVAFREKGDEKDLEIFARGILARAMEDEYLPVLEQGDGNLHIVNDLGIDSLSMAEIAMNLEDALDVELLDEDLKNLQTLNDVKTYLLQRYAARKTDTSV